MINFLLRVFIDLLLIIIDVDWWIFVWFFFFVIIWPFFFLALAKSRGVIFALAHVGLAVVKHVWFALNDFDVGHIDIYLSCEMLRLEFAQMVGILLKALADHLLVRVLKLIHLHILLLILTSYCLLIKLLVCLIIIGLGYECSLFSVVHWVQTLRLWMHVSVRRFSLDFLVLHQVAIHILIVLVRFLRRFIMVVLQENDVSLWILILQHMDLLIIVINIYQLRFFSCLMPFRDWCDQLITIIISFILILIDL